jgi:hypothetical protein
LLAKQTNLPESLFAIVADRSRFTNYQAEPIIVRYFRQCDEVSFCRGALA